MNNNDKYRPRLDPEIEKKIQAFTNRLGLTNLPKSQISNFFIGIGVECMDRTLDRFVSDLKVKEFKENIMKFLTQ